MPRDIVVVGCGGHGREVFDVLRSAPVDASTGEDLNVLGFVDDAPASEDLERVSRLGSQVLGPLDWLCTADTGVGHVLGIGDPRVRRALEVSGALGHRRWSPVVVHPAASVGSHVRLGEGSVLFAGARITTNVELGRHVHVNQSALVAHDCVVGDHGALNPAAVVSGSCVVGPAALIGANACVLQGLRIGEGARVGAGACVVHDVAPGATVVGIPAR